uniref:Putative secreted protein n=1 Tax=Anopheles darlingi TaxID=43151 RepID=A0A2M4D2T2_ANODA
MVLIVLLLLLVIRYRRNAINKVRLPAACRGRIQTAQTEQQPLQSLAKVLQVVRIEQRIEGRVEVGERDNEQHDGAADLAVRTERHDAVDRVQRHPADHEK